MAYNTDVSSLRDSVVREYQIVAIAQSRHWPEQLIQISPTPRALPLRQLEGW